MQPDAMSPHEAELAAAIPKLARTSVLVVGDLMLDRYIYGSVSRISPEAPIPVLAVDRELILPGGAGNVVRNLTALGVATAFISVVGDDQAGSDLTGLIGGQPNVEPWLLVQGGRCTTVKTRFVARGQQLLRSDQEVTGPIHPKLVDRMLRITGDAMAATSVTVLSDYRKGVLSDDVPTRIIAAARAAGRPVVVDPRGPDFDRYAHADIVVPSLRELELATGMSVAGDLRIAAAARWLRLAHGFGAVVVNRGAEGISLISADHEMHLPSSVPEVFDLSGAGDCVVSAVAAAIAAGLDLPTAARLANLALGLVSGQPGMAVAQGNDLLAALTPSGRAMRRVVPAEAAVAQFERWRKLGLRTAFCVARGEEHDGASIARARGVCDRLVVGVAAVSRPQTSLGEIAALPGVDLVCVYEGESEDELLSALRPDLLVDPAQPAED